MENTATPRQRWALYCITHKDYRNEILSKEEAVRLIKELGDPNYKKAKKMKKSISEELLDYLKENIDEMYQACLGEMSCKSVIEDDDIKIGGFKAVNSLTGLCLDETFDSKLEEQKAWFYSNSSARVSAAAQK